MCLGPSVSQQCQTGLLRIYAVPVQARIRVARLVVMTQRNPTDAYSFNLNSSMDLPVVSGLHIHMLSLIYFWRDRIRRHMRWWQILPCLLDTIKVRSYRQFRLTSD